MTETNLKQCRICLATDDKVPVSDATCYIEPLIQVLPLKNMNGKFLLCIWCTSALKKALAVVTMLLESEKKLHDKNSIEVSSQHESLFNLNIVHNSHIDIPPLKIEDKNITEELDHTENEIKNEDLIIEDIIIKGERKNRKEFEFKNLNFEVEYLNLEQQMKEVELKKLKYKEFEFQCDLCGIGYLTSDVFDEHRIRHSEVAGPNKCTICCLHFKSQDVLSQHMLAHKRRFKCMLCNHVFKRWSHCTSHRYKCGGTVQPVACEVCAKIFSNEHSLKIHMKVHKAERKYCCDQCDRKFATKQRLTVHMRSHSGVLPFSCAQCARSFATKCNLRAHASVHEMCTQHYCVECHTHYKTNKSLKRHFRESVKHALGSDMYSCKECTKKFPNETALSKHVNTRHGTEYRCTHCDKTFSNNSNLNKHIKCIHAQ
nr:zinc finger protein 90 isoform X1 [Helicoverpa armigera]